MLRRCWCGWARRWTVEPASLRGLRLFTGFGFVWVTRAMLAIGQTSQGWPEVVVGCIAEGVDGLLIKPADGPGRSQVHHAMGLAAALLTNVQVLPSMVAEEPADS